MEYIIREMKEKEIPLLDKFLYHAIFVPEGGEVPPESIIDMPEMQIYVKDFGQHINDRCLVAVSSEFIIGAVWTRLMKDYGHVDENTPSFAISVLKEYQGLGIGTRLMEEMLDLLKRSGCLKASLSVQKANYAVKMYLKVGFKIISENEEEYIMVNELNGFL
jgi:ribosomal protein S18 acetylase RimI-like enzyme